MADAGVRGEASDAVSLSLLLRTRRGRLVAVLAGIGALLGLPGSARAIPAIDQQQPVMNTSIAFGVGGSSEQKLAQVVVSGVAGLVTEIRVPLSCEPAASVTLEINDADTSPGGANLARSTFPGSLFPPGPVWPEFRSIPLGAPPFIPAATQFAFILSASGDCGLVPGPVGEVYTRGNSYFDSRPNPPGVWVCNCDFSNTPYDLAFQTFVDPLCRVPKVLGQKRADADATIRQYGCALGSVKSKFASAKAGTVIDQAPDAGTQLASGGAVDLAVSLGPQCVVPRVVGKTLRGAGKAIVRAHCRLGRVTRVYSARVTGGRVIAQTPRPGVRVRPHARVNLVVSRGSR